MADTAGTSSFPADHGGSSTDQAGVKDLLRPSKSSLSDEAPTLASLDSGSQVIMAFNALRELINDLPTKVKNLGSISEQECWMAYRSHGEAIENEFKDLRSKDLSITNGSLEAERDHWRDEVEKIAKEAKDYEDEAEKWRNALSAVRSEIKKFEQEIIEKSQQDRADEHKGTVTGNSAQKIAPVRPSVRLVRPTPTAPSPLELHLNNLRRKLRDRKFLVAQKFADTVKLQGFFDECAKEAAKSGVSKAEIDGLKRDIFG
jgi:hypothetical protein